MQVEGSYRRCSIDPDDHALLIGRHLLVDVDTFLQVDQHGHERHEGEHRVQDEAKDVQICEEGTGNGTLNTAPWW